MVLAVLKFLVLRVILKITSLGSLFVFSFNAHIIYTEEPVFSRGNAYDLLPNTAVTVTV